MLSLNSDKANKILHWHNKWNINKSLEQIIKWENNSNKKNISDYSINQIIEFMKLDNSI